MLASASVSVFTPNTQVALCEFELKSWAIFSFGNLCACISAEKLISYPGESCVTVAHIVILACSRVFCELSDFSPIALNENNHPLQTSARGTPNDHGNARKIKYLDMIQRCFNKSHTARLCCVKFYE
jgi:hypothetical protein